MDIHLVDPEEVPQSPELVRFKNVWIHAYPDRRRVKLKLDVKSFLESPNVEIEAYNSRGDCVASTSIIELNSTTLEITLHLRGDIPAGKYICKLSLCYHGNELVDHREVPFIVPEPDHHESG
jgi:hypothetical protein